MPQPLTPAPLPCHNHAAPLVRTCFSDERSWQTLLVRVGTPSEDDFLANVDVVDDVAYADCSPERIAGLTPPEKQLVVIADEHALSAPGNPLLVVRTGSARHAELRVVTSQLWSIENNLTWANMDWDEFVAAADEDGVFRGF
ncbi:DUF6924 domain-containing protein [Streptomyces sp. NPDC050535]|uniref:DUF6924 domain-containing protein n=1 Tax=Streptomyces sp. NPDC050535 TaxID=3365626 RepID=UPI0037AB48DA